MSDELSWYAVRFLLENLHPEEPGCSQFFEERIIVVKAADEDAARAKTVEHARSQEHEYQNAFGKPVQVVFREVLDVQDILDGEIADLTEVYYHFLNAEEVDQVRRSLEPGSVDERRTAVARPARARPARA